MTLRHWRLWVAYAIRFRVKLEPVLPDKSDSEVMFCLQGYQGLRIERLHVY